MIKLFVIIALASAVVSVPVQQEPIAIISQESESDYQGKYHYAYESGDGTKAQADGQLVVFDKDHAGEVVKGTYQYVGDNGKTYSVNYVADETGFHPEGDHLPKVPEAIAKALKVLPTTVPPPQDKH